MARRAGKIQKMSKSFHKIKNIYEDMNELALDQGKTLDVIESNAVSAKSNMR